MKISKIWDQSRNHSLKILLAPLSVSILKMSFTLEQFQILWINFPFSFALFQDFFSYMAPFFPAQRCLKIVMNKFKFLN